MRSLGASSVTAWSRSRRIPERTARRWRHHRLPIPGHAWRQGIRGWGCLRAALRTSRSCLARAPESKWLPLHTLAASRDFYLLDNLLKHKVDVNALDKDGFPAIRKAVIRRSMLLSTISQGIQQIHSSVIKMVQP